MRKLIGVEAAALGQNIKVRMVPPIKYEFLNECAKAVVKVTYDWDIGVKIKGPSPPKVRTFGCERTRDAWLCKPKR